MEDPPDDASIPDEAVLWRRIRPDWIYWESEPPRPSSISFVDRRSGELSVHRAELTDVDTVLADHPTWSLVAFSAGVVRSLGEGQFTVQPAPTQDDPSHAIIRPRLNKTTGGVLARAAEWVLRRER